MTEIKRMDERIGNLIKAARTFMLKECVKCKSADKCDTLCDSFYLDGIDISELCSEWAKDNREAMLEGYGDR